MTGRWLFAVLIAGLFVVGCKSSSRVETVQVPAPKTTEVTAPAQTPPVAAPLALAAPVSDGGEIIKVTAKLAPETLTPKRRGGGGHASCPQSQLQELFGVSFSSPHGCVVGGIAPGSLAEQAGIKPGDSITECNGAEVTCPMSLLQQLPLGKEPGLIEFTLVRRKQGTEQPKA